MSGSLDEIAREIAWNFDPVMMSDDRDALKRQILAALKAERERCAAMADQWQKAGHVLLHAGEMTAQELRTAQAVAGGIAAAIRGREGES